MDSQHRNHRSRVKERYINYGLEVFQDYEALELLLFYAVPQKDTKPLAKNLIDRFGSLPAVLGASVEELMEAGLTQNMAILLNMIPAMNRKIDVLRNRDRKYIRSTADAGQYLCGEFRNEQEESIRLLCLDSAGKILNIGSQEKLRVDRSLLGKGDVNSVHFSVRKIVEAAVSCKAVSVILAHNHPSGMISPSREDIDATSASKAALETIGVRLLDHFIISGDHYCSMREEGYL